MRQKSLNLLFASISYNNAFAQPVITSQKVIEDGDWDEFTSMALINDSGYFLGDSYESNSSGDKSENSTGLNDYWIVKPGNSGCGQRDKTIKLKFMNHFTLLCLIFLSFLNLHAQQDISTFCDVKDCYQQNPCYLSTDVIINHKDYTYAQTSDIFGNDPDTYKLDLKIAVYSVCTLPDSATVPYDPVNGITSVNTPSCTDCKRPFILLIHGGGFNQGCKDSLADECIRFARRGYVAATIDYRLGWKSQQYSCYTNRGPEQFCLQDPTTPPDEACPETNQCNEKTNLHAAAYKAVQDGHAALRYMAFYATLFNVDTSYFYIGGESAGAMTAANLTYLNQTELDNRFSDLLDTTGKNIYGRYDMHGNTLRAAFSVKGQYFCWGAIFDKLDIVGKSDKIPMIAFHCENDLVAPYPDNGILLRIPCPKGELGIVDGSHALFSRLKNSYPGQVPVELYHQKLGGHAGILNATPAERDKRVELVVCFFRKCRLGDTAQKSILVTPGVLPPVECSLGGDFTSNISRAPVEKQGVNKFATPTSQNTDALKTLNGKAFILYPNPSKERLYIQTNGKATFSLTNQSDKLMLTKIVIGNGAINIAHLPAGVYYVKNNTTGAAQKLVVEK